MWIASAGRGTFATCARKKLVTLDSDRRLGSRSRKPATLVASARPLALDGEAVLVASRNPVNTDECNHRLEQIPPARRSPSQFHQTATAAHADHEQSEPLL